MLTSNKKPHAAAALSGQPDQATFSYDTGEIAKLFGIHPNTVRHWLKDGLRAIR